MRHWEPLGLSRDLADVPSHSHRAIRPLVGRGDQELRARGERVVTGKAGAPPRLNSPVHCRSGWHGRNPAEPSVWAWPGLLTERQVLAGLLSSESEC